MGLTDSIEGDLISDDELMWVRAKDIMFFHFVTDTDGDGLLDGLEILIGTNPVLADTDGDGINDGQEVILFNSDPLVSTDTPANGDVTEDGQINTGDLIVCRRFALSDIASPTERQRVRCDVVPVNSITGITKPDGLINVSDLSRLTQIVLQY